MFLRLRKCLYLLLAVGSLAGALFALAGLFTGLALFVSGVAQGSWAGAGIALILILACVAGATGPVWIVLTVIALPDPPPAERRRLTFLLSSAIIAAGAVVFSMATGADGDYTGFSTPLLFFVLPMFVGVALLTELWLPVWRQHLRGV